MNDANQPTCPDHPEDRAQISDEALRRLHRDVYGCGACGGRPCDRDDWRDLALDRVARGDLVTRWANLGQAAWRALSHAAAVLLVVWILYGYAPCRCPDGAANAACPCDCAECVCPKGEE